MADLNLNVTESLKLVPSELVSSLAKTTPSTLVEYLVANETIFPSGYDIAAVVGDGITMRERSLSDNWLAILTNNFTFSGLVIPGSSVNLNIIVPLGVACIAGRYVSVPATQVTAVPSTTSYVFLKVSRDANGNVLGAWYEVNTSGTPPVDATPIATLISSGVAVTSTTDARLLGPGGIITLTAGVAWIVPAGITRAKVTVFSGGGGGAGASGGGAGATAGGNGGAGGTSTFSTLSVTGGGGGTNGPGQGPANGVGSGGQMNRTGGGQSGGIGSMSSIGAGDGTNGGVGGVAISFVALTVGASITIAIGAAGTAGAAGAGAIPGFAGRVGQAGLITVEY